MVSVRTTPADIGDDACLPGEGRLWYASKRNDFPYQTNEEEKMTTEEALLYAIASDTDIPLDAHTSGATVSADGTIYVCATPETIPTHEDERRLLKAGLHACLTDGFAEQYPHTHVVVQVIVPLCTVDASPFKASAYICEQNASFRNFLSHSMRMMTHLCLQKILEAYPWRHLEEMTRRATLLTTSLMGETLVDCDCVLVPVTSLVNDYVFRVVLRDVEALLLCKPRTLLEVYESVYRLGIEWKGSLETMRLFDLLFHR